TSAAESFDHLVCAREQGWRDSEVDRLRGIEVDDQVVFYRRLYREIAGLFALEDAVDVGDRASVHVNDVRPIGEEATVHGEESERIDCWQAIAARQREDQLAAIIDRIAGGDNESSIRRACGITSGIQTADALNRALDLAAVAHDT